jgi:hypothetical protein
MFAARLVGQECTTVTGGAGSGSVIGLGFGDRLRRIKPLRNPTLTEADRKYASEFELTIYCGWRLRDQSAVLCGWREAGDDRIWALLRTMRGRRVESVTVQARSQDLCVSFEGALSLDVFCDITAQNEFEDNYTFADKEIVGAVGVKSVLAEPSPRRRTLFLASE